MENNIVTINFLIGCFYVKCSLSEKSGERVMQFVIVYFNTYMCCHHLGESITGYASATLIVTFVTDTSNLGVPGKHSVDGQLTADVGLLHCRKGCRAS
jgi:hypothetical protein